MAAAATQQAPQRAPKTADRKAQQKKPEGVKEKLGRIPRAAGMAIMAVLLVV